MRQLSIEEKIGIVKNEIVGLREQNAIQASQINWCAEMIFALVGVIRK